MAETRFAPLVDLEDEAPRRAVETRDEAEERAFLEHLRRGVVGADAAIRTPEGEQAAPLLRLHRLGPLPPRRRGRAGRRACCPSWRTRTPTRRAPGG